MKIIFLLTFQVLYLNFQVFSSNQLYVLDDIDTSTFSNAELDVFKEFDIKFMTFNAHKHVKIHNRSIQALNNTFGKEWKRSVLNKLDSVYHRQDNPKKNAQVLLEQIEDGWVLTTREEKFNHFCKIFYFEGSIYMTYRIKRYIGYNQRPHIGCNKVRYSSMNYSKSGYKIWIKKFTAHYNCPPM